MSDVILNSYVNLSNNELSLVLDCSLKEYYVFKKASQVAVEYLLANDFPGPIEIDFLEKESFISTLLSLAKVRMIESKISEDDVNITSSNVILVLREIMYNYIGRIRALGYDPYNINIDVNDRVEEINNYFDGLINILNEDELVLKREKI